MSDLIKDGGQAFPTNYDHGGGLIQTLMGMSLRDYFAAKAMQGFAADLECTFITGLPGMAKCAYQWADAMLEAREGV